MLFVGLLPEALTPPSNRNNSGYNFRNDMTGFE